MTSVDAGLGEPPEQRGDVHTREGAEMPRQKSASLTQAGAARTYGTVHSKDDRLFYFI